MISNTFIIEGVFYIFLFIIIMFTTARFNHRLTTHMCEPCPQVEIYRSDQNCGAIRANIYSLSRYVAHALPASWRRMACMKAYALDVSCTYEGSEAFVASLPFWQYAQVQMIFKFSRLGILYAAFLMCSVWFCLVSPHWMGQSGSLHFSNNNTHYDQAIGLWLNYTVRSGEEWFDPGNSNWTPSQGTAVDSFQAQWYVIVAVVVSIISSSSLMLPDLS